MTRSQRRTGTLETGNDITSATQKAGVRGTWNTPYLPCCDLVVCCSVGLWLVKKCCISMSLTEEHKGKVFSTSVQDGCRERRMGSSNTFL